MTARASRASAPRLVKDEPLAPNASAIQALALELEREKGKTDTHDKVCEERYQAINGTMAALGENIAAVDSKVDGLDDKMDALTKNVAEMATVNATAIGVAQGLAQARKPKWWVGPLVTILAVLLGAAFATFGWMASRILADNDRFIAEARQRPTASSTVLVNPAPTPSAAATAPAP